MPLEPSKACKCNLQFRFRSIFASPAPLRILPWASQRLIFPPNFVSCTAPPFAELIAGAIQRPRHQSCQNTSQQFPQDVSGQGLPRASKDNGRRNEPRRIQACPSEASRCIKTIQQTSSHPLVSEAVDIGLLPIKRHCFFHNMTEIDVNLILSCDTITLLLCSCQIAAAKSLTHITTP